MGTIFDDFSDRAATNYFEGMVTEKTHDNGTSIPLHNRRLLYSIMTSVGFTNYFAEWWHFDYGNQFWAFVSAEKTAIYGQTSPGLR